MRPRQREVLARSRDYLVGQLLPFWIERAPDPAGGGFLTHFDRDGRPTGATSKSLLMQVRTLYTMASAHRAGYGDGRCAELAHRGADYLLAHYEDPEHGGFYWWADRDGRVTDPRKIGYGQCFILYAFAEYGLATGDPRGEQTVRRTLHHVQTAMADHRHGGFREIMQRDWQPAPGGRGGGDRKSFDVHMHMLEALTSVFQLTGEADHRQALLAVIDLLTGRMLDPTHGLGIQQFRADFTPVPAIRFDVAWGRDEEPADGSIPVTITSYGHNVEFAWLLLRAGDMLGLPRDRFLAVARTQGEHCLRFGIDRQCGGVYIDGPMDRPTANLKKQFWQQAEVLIGCLALLERTGDERYWDAFLNVFDFVFDHFVHLPGGGEWFHLLDRAGQPIEDHLADGTKINYHTVRCMIEVVRRLRALGAAAPDR